MLGTDTTHTPILGRSPPCPNKTSSASSASPLCSPRTDIIKPLKAALDHVQSLRCQAVSQLSLEESIHLPCELARTWLESRSSPVPAHAQSTSLSDQKLAFFEDRPVDMFLSFTNVKLLKLVPDLIDMPDVTIRPVIHVLFYSMLHYGACMPKHYALQDETRELDWPTLVFVRALKILPAWQLEATGTETDFAATILLVGVLGWSSVPSSVHH